MRESSQFIACKISEPDSTLGFVQFKNSTPEAIILVAICEFVHAISIVSYAFQILS